MADPSAKIESRRRLVVAVYRDQTSATGAVERLVEEDFPMDSISLLGRALDSGDDPIGIYYSGVGDRMKAWGVQGALWGGLWGLLAGAAGMFVLPGLGPILATGPVAEALAGTVTGATVTGGAMAGGAALSELAAALHRMGIPRERLRAFHRAIEQGHYVVLLRCGRDEVERWRRRLAWNGMEELDEFPFYP